MSCVQEDDTNPTLLRYRRGWMAVERLDHRLVRTTRSVQLPVDHEIFQPAKQITDGREPILVWEIEDDEFWMCTAECCLYVIEEI